MNEQYYIAADGQQQGPFTIEDLKEKGIRKDTLVWTEGLEDWTKAEYIPVLKNILKATPPPLPKTETKSTSQQVPPLPTPTQSVPTDKYFGYELARRRERFFAALVEIIIIGISFLVIYSQIKGEDFWNEDYGYFSVQSLKETIFWTSISVILGAILYPMWSGNLGHKIMGLKVISSVDGKDQNSAGAGAFREALKSLFGFVFIPVVWLLWDDNRQNLYDKVVKTYVVKKSKSDKEIL